MLMSFNENGLEMKFNELPAYANRPLRRCVGDLGIVSRGAGSGTRTDRQQFYRNPIERVDGRAPLSPPQDTHADDGAVRSRHGIQTHLQSLTLKFRRMLENYATEGLVPLALQPANGKSPDFS